MSKKLIALLLAAMMMLSLAAACGNDAPAETPTTPTTPAPTTPAETPTTPAPTEPADPDADKYGGDLIIATANATIINSRTMVPLRSIFEAMGADVQWDNATRTASGQRGGTSVSIAIGSNVLYVNGRAVGLDSPACIINNRTMVPVRAIAEAFQATVDWDNPSRTVIITE